MTSIILCFFSPCGYELPKQHLVECVNRLLHLKVEIVVVQVVMSGEKPVPIPSECKSFVFKIKHHWFRKENLWNKGAELSTGDTLVFLDSDIFFKDDQWLDKTNDLLERHDIVQPFEIASWQSADECTVEATKIAAAKGLREKQLVNFGVYHPGFAWAMKRKTFNKIGGLYDRAIVGSGDTAFSISFVDDKTLLKQISSISHHYYYGSRSFKAYRRNILAHNFSVSELSGVTIYHLWHGTRGNRQYHQRVQITPPPEDKEFELEILDNGLLELKNIHDANNMMTYFKGREEDGRPPVLFLIATSDDDLSPISKVIFSWGFHVHRTSAELEAGNTAVNDVILFNKRHRRPAYTGLRDLDCVAGLPEAYSLDEIASDCPDSKFILYTRGENHDFPIFQQQNPRFLVVNARELDITKLKELEEFLGRKKPPWLRSFPRHNTALRNK